MLVVFALLLAPSFAMANVPPCLNHLIPTPFATAAVKQGLTLDGLRQEFSDAKLGKELGNAEKVWEFFLLPETSLTSYTMLNLEGPSTHLDVNTFVGAAERYLQWGTWTYIFSDEVPKLRSILENHNGVKPLVLVFEDFHRYQVVHQAWIITMIHGHLVTLGKARSSLRVIFTSDPSRFDPFDPVEPINIHQPISPPHLMQIRTAVGRKGIQVMYNHATNHWWPLVDPIYPIEFKPLTVRIGGTLK